jgi:glycosyltransferase involved in cell wall biosynthesis
VAKPLVTIGVCVRNGEDTIKEAIESIIEQDFPHKLVELLVVDGYSEDKTLFIIKKSLESSVIKSKIFGENKGLGYARQIVVDNAEGEYIVWVDGDMIISRDYVRKLSDFMKRHPEVGIAKGKQALEPGANLLATLEAFSRAAGKMVDYQSKRAYSKALGTSGSIYRTRAVRQVGGFDKDLKGYGEDWDVEIRVREAGWSLLTIDAKYLDYERRGLTWKTLWSRYWRRGYDMHYFLHKNRGLIKHYRMFPPAAFLSGLLHAYKLFKITQRKTVFLLPFQYAFKVTAWYVGFIKSHLNSHRRKYDGHQMT